MKNSFLILLFLIALLLLAILLYASFLDRIPIHLNQDELGFALNAYSISQSLHDIDGQRDQIGPFKKTDTIYEPDGNSTFYIFRN